MVSIIEELYYGRINPSEVSYSLDGEYAKLLGLRERHQKSIEAGTEVADSFEKYRDCCDELSSTNERMAFIRGFKLGLSLTAEALLCPETKVDETIK